MSFMRDGRGQVAPECHSERSEESDRDNIDSSLRSGRQGASSNGSNSSNKCARPRYCVTFVTMALMLQPTAVGYYSPRRGLRLHSAQYDKGRATLTLRPGRQGAGSNGSNGSNNGARPRYCVTFVTMALMLQPTAVGYYNPECHSIFALLPQI